MTTDNNNQRLHCEQRLGDRYTTPRGTQNRLSEKADELAAISPLLQQLGRQAPPEVSAHQWREFTLDLAEKLDRELKGKSPRKLSERIRDQVSATDSKVLRGAIVAGALAVLMLLAFVGWVLTTTSGQALFEDTAGPLLSSASGVWCTLRLV